MKVLKSRSRQKAGQLGCRICVFTDHDSGRPPPTYIGYLSLSSSPRRVHTRQISGRKISCQNIHVLTHRFFFFFFFFFKAVVVLSSLLFVQHCWSTRRHDNSAGTSILAVLLSYCNIALLVSALMHIVFSADQDSDSGQFFPMLLV